MTCEEIKSKALAYIYGELTPTQRRSAEAHLAGCETCRVEVKGMTEMADLVGKVEQVAPSTEFHRRFEALVASTSPSSSTKARRAAEEDEALRPRAWRLAVACAAAFALLAWLRVEWAPMPAGMPPRKPPTWTPPVPPELSWKDTDLETLKTLVASRVAATTAAHQSARSGAARSEGDDEKTQTGSDLLASSAEYKALGAQTSLIHWKMDPSPVSTLDREVESLRDEIRSADERLGEGS